MTNYFRSDSRELVDRVLRVLLGDETSRFLELPVGAEPGAVRTLQSGRLLQAQLRLNEELIKKLKLISQNGKVQLTLNGKRYSVAAEPKETKKTKPKAKKTPKYRIADFKKKFAERLRRSKEAVREDSKRDERRSIRMIKDDNVSQSKPKAPNSAKPSKTGTEGTRNQTSTQSVPKSKNADQAPKSTVDQKVIDCSSDAVKLEE